eukprot:486519-Hanusia_phi.AAC.2
MVREMIFSQEIEALPNPCDVQSEELHQAPSHFRGRGERQVLESMGYQQLASNGLRLLEEGSLRRPGKGEGDVLQGLYVRRDLECDVRTSGAQELLPCESA